MCRQMNVWATNMRHHSDWAPTFDTIEFKARQQTVNVVFHLIKWIFLSSAYKTRWMLINVRIHFVKFGFNDQTSQVPLTRCEYVNIKYAIITICSRNKSTLNLRYTFLFCLFRRLRCFSSHSLIVNTVFAKPKHSEKKIQHEIK